MAQQRNMRLLSFEKVSPEILHYCNDWSKAGDPSAVIYIYWTKAESHRQWSEGITGISEAEQRRKQYQAGVEVTGTGSEVQGQAVRGHTQR